MVHISGSSIVIKTLKCLGVDVIFGYPGGAVLPIYDELFKDNAIRHILVRHEQGAVHAAEGYARATGKPGVCLVTSGPGVTNIITGLQNAYMDSTPIVCISGQVATFLIGTDAFQEADATGIAGPCTKHATLVRDVNQLARKIHEAFYIAKSGRPGPVLIDLPKDVQVSTADYIHPESEIVHPTYKPSIRSDISVIQQAVDMMKYAHRPVFYTGGGVINSGDQAGALLYDLANITNFPVTSTLMGLGGFPASDSKFLGMLGMHGTYEANLAMYHADLIVCVGARFDDRITGKLSEFSPGSRVIHIDIDRSSISKNVHADIPIVSDVSYALKDIFSLWKKICSTEDQSSKLNGWWQQINEWRAVECLKYQQSTTVIKPQYAVDRLYAATKDMDVYITTEVGQHQMWAAQRYKFESMRRWVTSGGLGTMGFGVPAAVGIQVAYPDSLVIDIAGEASFLMTMQEMSTAVQFRLPVKIFILNNERLGMVRQWQQLLHGERYSSSYSESLPDFCLLAKALGCHGIKCEDPADLDRCIKEMIDYPGPVIFDCVVEKDENCFPMIPAGCPHNEMLLGDQPYSSGSESDDDDQYDKHVMV